MPSYTCKRCEQVWSSEEIAASIFDYGFINLTSQENEIIAFSCPNDKCSSLITIKGSTGISNDFFDKNDLLMDSKGRNLYPKFNYYSSLPLPQRSNEILKLK